MRRHYKMPPLCLQSAAASPCSISKHTSEQAQKCCREEVQGADSRDWGISGQLWCIRGKIKLKESFLVFLKPYHPEDKFLHKLVLRIDLPEISKHSQKIRKGQEKIRKGKQAATEAFCSGCRWGRSSGGIQLEGQSALGYSSEQEFSHLHLRNRSSSGKSECSAASCSTSELARCWLAGIQLSVLGRNISQRVCFNVTWQPHNRTLRLHLELMICGRLLSTSRSIRQKLKFLCVLIFIFLYRRDKTIMKYWKNNWKI